MKLIQSNLVVAAAILLVAALSFVVALPHRSGAQQQLTGNVYSKVTLYSQDGKVLGTWTADGLGRMDGNTFVFDVYRGVGSTYSREVRISGTFTVEQTAP